ncbi:hypothetical protein ACHAPT_012784 [Fusarium lateritium]
MARVVASLRAGNARIAGALKACLDILSDILAHQAFEGEWISLQAKLDIERTLLLHWAEKVKLMDTTGYDKCLDDPKINLQAIQLICGVQTILIDRSQLEERFGVKTYEQEDSLPDASYLTSYLILSRPRMDMFNIAFACHKLHLVRVPGTAATVAKYRWVASDILGFEEFIQRIGQLVDDLNNLTCSPDCLECSTQMAKEDVKRVRTMDDLRVVRDAAKGVRDSISESAEEVLGNLARRRVMKNLWFRGMHERRSNLRDAHPGTYEWALREPQPGTEWDSLVGWLQSGSDPRTYWVSGLPGAGKSTLLKYIFDHPDTEKHLAVWGGDEPVSVGSYFFWNMGSVFQRTRDGMARAILFHILAEIPSLIPILVPTMWKFAYEGTLLESHEQLPLPSVSDVWIAFERMEQGGLLEKRFCFFIDALEEYGGEDLRAINFIEKLSQSPNIKVVVSSRPTSNFAKAYADTPKLQLHDLNHGDMLQYVRDKANAHEYVATLRDIHEPTTVKLFQGLVQKAFGVFLWAVLATKAMLQGFDMFEGLYDLQLRILDLPLELNDLFEHILLLVEPRHREEAGRILRICHRSVQKRQDEAERGRTWTVSMAAVEEKDLDFEKFEPYREMGLLARHRQCLALEHRIALCCGGLLDVVRSDGEDVEECVCGAGEHPEHDVLIDSSIEFVHVTVFEWFGRMDSLAASSLGIQDPSFNAHAALSTMSRYQPQVARQLGAPFTREDLDMARCMRYVQRADQFKPKFADMMVHKIHELVALTRRTKGNNWYFSFCCKVDGNATERLETLYFGVAMGMVHFVRYYLEKNEGPSLCDLELSHAMEWWRVAADRTLAIHLLEPHAETIKRLSSRGPMLLYLASHGVPVPRADLMFHLKAESLEEYGELELIEQVPQVTL